jgi:hypothetical protein
MDTVFESKWKQTLENLTPFFGEKPDMESLLFMIGVQELGGKFRKFKKDEKLDVMHIAICTLLEPFGYYTFAGNDPEGWPHFESTEKLPFLKPLEQNRLMRQAIIEYFENDTPFKFGETR